ncbi:hypothetical protein [Arthrobacter sp. SX1312]|nr:hypothetical protein [Arthrobacter sp. SX1312]
MTTDSSADEQGVVSPVADVVEQASDARRLDIAVRLGFATIRTEVGRT